MKRSTILLLTVGAIGLGAGGLRAELPPLIPRAVLFGNPDKVKPRISPDGKRLAYVAPDAAQAATEVRIEIGVLHLQEIPAGPGWSKPGLSPAIFEPDGALMNRLEPALWRLIY